MVERGTLNAEVAGSKPASPAIVIEQVEIIEPKWTPYEVMMWQAGLVPFRWVSREECEAKYGPRP
jgi:hypothetical protein